MNILQINAVNGIASTGRSAKEMNDFLRHNGHNCVISYSKGPSFDPEHEYRIGSNLDTKIHGLLSRLTGKQGYFSRGATKKLLKFMDGYKPDVVVLRNLHGNYINLPMLLKYLAKNDIATVVVLHDCWFYTGKCCHYTVQGCFKWQVACGGCPQLKNHNKSWFFDHTKKMLADKKRLFGAIPRLAVVGVSDWIKNEAKKAPVFENAKIITRIYNWIDTEEFSPKDTEELRKKLGLEGKKVILSVASGWNKDKGLDTVLELSEKLNADEHIVLVGNLPSDVSLNDKILHIPATNSVDELAELYSMADVFLQPSLEETFGKVTAEALACGTPVVCFDSTTTPELVGENCGFVVECSNINKMYEAICKCFTFKAINSAVCRSSAINLFSKQTNLPSYLNLFNELNSKESSSTMKVVQINSVYGVGSTGNIVKSISNELTLTGNHSYVAFGRGCSSNQNHFVINNQIEQKLSILQTRIWGMHGFHNSKPTRRLIKWLDSVNPDIIHLHNVHGHYLNNKLLFNYIRQKNIKVVWTLHDCWPFTGHCAHFASIKCNKWISGCSSCPNLKSYPTTYGIDSSSQGWKQKNKIFNQLPKDNMIFVSTSDWVKSIQQQSFLSKYDCVTINNGIDLSVFKPTFAADLRSSVCNENDFLVLGFAGKWLLDSNKSTLEFLDRNLPSNIKILLIGTETLPADYSNRFIAHPFVNDAAKLAQFYSISDVFVNLTHEDTFPTVNIESLACGTPVITNDVCGSSEIIDSETGFSVQEYDHEELLQAILKIYNTSKKSFSEKCIKRAENYFEKQRKYNEYIDLYRRLAKK